MYFNNLPRQCVQNINIDNDELQNKNNNELSKINSGWRIKKMYQNRCINFNPNNSIDCTKIYRGYITNYFIEKIIMQDGTEIFYIKILVTVKLPEKGVGELVYKTSANFTPNSDLCKLLFDLGFNVGTMTDFNPDLLIDIPVLVNLKYNQDYIEIDKIKRIFYKI